MAVPFEITQAEKEREYLVVKKNDLVRKARYSLSAQEQKLILYCISKIKPTDEDFTEYTFDLKDLCRVCGIAEHGQNYHDFKSAIKRLADKSFWVHTEREDILCRWLHSVKIYRDETKISVKLDETLRPYLLQLRENTVRYELENILAMGSKYSIRLFEVLQSYAFLGEASITLDDLRELLQTANYSVWKDFKRRVIEPAVAEINLYTDISVSYETVKTGRAIHALTFTIKKKDLFERMTASAEKNNVLSR